MWAESARHQSQPSNKQNQHDQRIEETRWPEIDMHVGNNARKNEERARDRKKPSDQAAPTPEKQAHSDQHRQKRDTESIASVKSPVGADHAYLIAEKVSSNASHGETDQEVAEPAGCPTHVAQGPIFHTGRISDARRLSENDLHRPACFGAAFKRNEFTLPATCVSGSSERALS